MVGLDGPISVSILEFRISVFRLDSVIFWNVPSVSEIGQDVSEIGQDVSGIGHDVSGIGHCSAIFVFDDGAFHRDEIAAI